MVFQARAQVALEREFGAGVVTDVDGSIGELDFTLKFNFNVASDEQREAQARKDWFYYINGTGLRPKDFGATILYNGRKHTIFQFSPNKTKFAISADSAAISARRDDGKVFRFTVDFVLRALGR